MQLPNTCFDMKKQWQMRKAIEQLTVRFELPDFSYIEAQP